MVQHIEYVHATEKIFKCDQCDYAHASQHGLNGMAVPIVEFSKEWYKIRIVLG